MNKFFLASIMLLLVNPLLAQEEYEAALLPAKRGAMIVYNGDSTAFTVRLDYDSLKPSDQPNLLLIEDWIVQFFTLGFDNPKNLDLSVNENAKTAIFTYVDYELDYFKNEVKLNYSNEKIEIGQMNGMTFCFWHFDTPSELASLQKQMYLTTVCFNQILNLNIPLMKEQSFEEAKSLLMDIGKNIVLHDHRIDIEKAYEDLNK